MKRVLFIADGLGSGGAERQMVTVARQLQLRGYEVEVLCYSENNFNEALLLADGVKVTWKIEKNYVQRVLSLRRYIRSGKYDAVISFLETPNFINNFVAIGRHNWKVITGERSSKDSTFHSRKGKVFAWFQRFSDCIVCNSYAAQEKWLRNRPQYGPKLCTIYNTVTLGVVNAQYQPRRDRRTNIVVAASHQYLKNAMGLAKAVSLMTDEQRLSIHIDWYGNKIKNATGDNLKPYSEVKDFVKDNELGDHISFYDPTKDLANKMFQADVVALFSKLEGLPNTICEGMTLGKPIVMSRVSDYQVLVDETNGFLCDWDNVESIKDALLSICNVPTEQLLKMGKASKEKAASLFSIEQVMQKWMDIIER